MNGRLAAAVAVLSGMGGVGFSLYGSDPTPVPLIKDEVSDPGLGDELMRRWSKRKFELTIEEDLRSRPAEPLLDEGAVVLHSAISFFLDYSGSVDLRREGDDVLLPLKATMDALPMGAKECAEDTRCDAIGDCRKRDECRELLGYWGAERAGWVPDSTGCNLTFTDEDTLVTAGHCLNGKDWSKPYLLVGSIDDGTIEGQFVRLPLERVVKIKCVYASQEQLIPGEVVKDWAILKIEPFDGKQIPPHYSMPLERCAPEKDAVVLAHIKGLPLLEHQVRPLGVMCSGKVRFTNSSGGSGAPVVQGGKVVGIVSGSSPSHVVLCSSLGGLPYCSGQPVTWTRDLLDVVNEGKRPMMSFDASDERVPPPICGDDERVR